MSPQADSGKILLPVSGPQADSGEMFSERDLLRLCDSMFFVSTAGVDGLAICARKKISDRAVDKNRIGFSPAQHGFNDLDISITY